MYCNTCKLKHKHYNWDFWKHMWYSTTCSRRTCVFYSSNTMGKHMHVRMPENANTHQRCDNEFTRNQHFHIFSSACKNRGIPHKKCWHSAHETLNWCFFPLGFYRPPCPYNVYIQYIYIYEWHILCMYVYTYAWHMYVIGFPPTYTAQCSIIDYVFWQRVDIKTL